MCKLYTDKTVQYAELTTYVKYRSYCKIQVVNLTLFEFNIVNNRV